MNSYLKHPLINREGQILFALRTRSLPLRNNQKIKYNYDTECKICCVENSVEDQIPLTSCYVLKGEIQEHEADIKYSDVFSSIEKQIQAVKLFKRLIQKRATFIEVMKI